MTINEVDESAPCLQNTKRASALHKLPFAPDNKPDALTAILSITGFVAALVTVLVTLIALHSCAQNRCISEYLPSIHNLILNHDFVACAPIRTLHRDVRASDFQDLEDAYEFTDDPGSQGKQSHAFVVSHIGSGMKYIARYIKNNHDDVGNYEQLLKVIEFGNLSCAHPNPHLMRLHDLRSDGDDVVQIVSICPGKPIFQFYGENAGSDPHCTSLTPLEVKTAVKHALLAVMHLEKLRVRHYDISMGNIMYDREKKFGCVIDFGISRYYPEWWWNGGDGGRVVDVGDGSKESAELLKKRDAWMYNEVFAIDLDNETTIYEEIRQRDDILGIAIALLEEMNIPEYQDSATWVFKKVPEWVELMGTNGLKEYIDKSGYEMFPYIEKRLKKWPKGVVDWFKYTTRCNKALLNRNTVDFLEGILDYNYTKRYMFVKNALAKGHPFFDGV